MPFFNGAIIIKNLWNIIYIFSENHEKRIGFYLSGYSHCIRDIETEYKKVFESS